MYKTLIATAIAVLPLLSDAAFADTASIPQRTIRFGYTLGPETGQGLGVRFFADRVQDRSGGKIKVETFPSAVLGSDVQQQAAAQGGIQEFLVPGPSTLVGTVKEFGIFDFPFLFSKTEEAFSFLDGPVGQELLDKLTEKNLIGLVYLENGWRHFTSSRRPIVRLEDFAGQKIRTMQSPVWVDLIKAVKATPVALPFDELFLALESKTVDGQENPISTIATYKFDEVQRYLSLSYHSYHPLIIVAGKPFWDKLSPAEQAIFREAAIETRTYQRKVARELETQSLAQLRQRGIAINEISPEERAKLKAAAKTVTDKYTQTIGQATVDRVYAELARINGP